MLVVAPTSSLGLFFPPPARPGPAPARLPPAQPQSHKRPRGLWRGRREGSSPTLNPAGRSHACSLPGPSSAGAACPFPSPYLSPRTHSRTPSVDPEHDDDDDDRFSSTSASSKRRRCDSSSFGEREYFTLGVGGSNSRFSPYAAHATVHTPLADLIDLDNAALRRACTPHIATPAASPVPLAPMSVPAFSSPAASPKGKEPSAPSADYEDWENLKELFAHAVERYDADDTADALPLLRAVMRECHRFLTVHPDPSVVFADRPPSRAHLHSSPRAHRPQSHTSRSPETDWDLERASSSVPDVDADADVPMEPLPALTSLPRRAHTHDLPTAFHALFGITLFLLGTLVAADARAALPGDPAEPTAYWLAALDVFETGENLPRRTAGPPPAPAAGPRPAGFGDLTEDWRMAVAWGRTLVCLADAKVEHTRRRARERAERRRASRAGAQDGAGAEEEGEEEYESAYAPGAQPFALREPAWAPRSVWAAVAAARPPVSRRTSLYAASAHEVLVLAMDQFSRGIFHMPHPHPHAGEPHPHAPHGHRHTQSLPSPATPRHGSPYPHARHAAADARPFSRARELFTLASEVLGVAERLAGADARAYWAGWADSVFTQMRMEADVRAWRAPLAAARGRCWLVRGSALAERVERVLEGRAPAGDEEGKAEGEGEGKAGGEEAGKADVDGAAVLQGREAAEAREGLGRAIEFFERARGAAADVSPERASRSPRAVADADAPRGGEGAEDVGPLLAEALFTLANLTPDECAREELYARARREAGERLARELGLDDADEEEGDRMDESA